MTEPGEITKNAAQVVGFARDLAGRSNPASDEVLTFLAKALRDADPLDASDIAVGLATDPVLSATAGTILVHWAKLR